MKPEDINELANMMIISNDMTILDTIESNSVSQLDELVKSIRRAVGFLLVNNMGFTPPMWDYEWDDIGDYIENVRKQYHVVLKENKLSQTQQTALQNWFRQISGWYNQKCNGKINLDIATQNSNQV